MSEYVFVREVGLRDGLQLIHTILSTEQKLEWCQRSAKAGLSEIEVTSFVPPKVVPQFQDAADVAKGAKAMGGFTPAALVPNLKGAQRGFEIGLPKLNFVLSASEVHNRANVRRTVQESIAEFDLIVRERDSIGKGRTRLAGGIATSFGCSMAGEVPHRDVIAIAARLADAGADEIVLADTVGYANPAAVRSLFSAVHKAIGDVPLAAHFHDTRGLGLANVVAALDVGVRRFDASLGGLGGCPFAPGATGNINTEDCVYLLEESGFDTGIQIGALIELHRSVKNWLPDEHLTGAIERAGLPKTFSFRHRPAA